MKIEDYPERIEELATTNLRIAEEIEKFRFLNSIEYDGAALNIALAVDEKGKLVFSNETQRNLALKLQLAAADGYQLTAAKIAGLEHEQKINSFRLERLRSQLSIAKLTIREE